MGNAQLARFMPGPSQRRGVAVTTASQKRPYEGPGVAPSRNVIGGELHCCCAEVRDSGIGTGFFRDGFCSTGVDDTGRHTVCCEVTEEFLAFSKAVGNDLSTPIPQFMFPGLLPGDRWCLCAMRWQQAFVNGYAPKVFLRRTHEATLNYCKLEDLKKLSLDLEEATAEVDRLEEMRNALAKSVAMPDADTPAEE